LKAAASAKLCCFLKACQDPHMIDPSSWFNIPLRNHSFFQGRASHSTVRWSLRTLRAVSSHLPRPFLSTHLIVFLENLLISAEILLPCYQFSKIKKKRGSCHEVFILMYHDFLTRTNVFFPCLVLSKFKVCY